MKKVLLLALLVYLLVLAQRSVFSHWSLGLFKPQSLQIMVIAVFYLVAKELEDESWWFLFVYFIFWDLLGFSRFPGLSSTVLIIFIWLFQQLRRRFLMGSITSLVVLFIFISSLDYLLRNFPRLGFGPLLNQILLNGVFYFIFYPVLALARHLVKPDSRAQLKLKI